MQTMIGKVISNKTAQTVTVAIPYTKKHPIYRKILTRETKILAHNEIEGIKIGDEVSLAKSKPFSKRKHFKVIEIIKDKKTK